MEGYGPTYLNKQRLI